ncbi:MAG: Imm72 family immunity protein [Myxococcota bacterium]|nr:Imm72 family immunity protein [Myxococcota bacterium]
MSGFTATNLQGHELAISLDDRRSAFWLHQKFTSRTYMRHMAALFANFVAGYEDFVKQKPAADYRENLREFLKYKAHLESGLRSIEAGQKSGYEELFVGCFFFEYLSGRRFEFGFENQIIGWRSDENHIGLYAWADVAVRMAWRIKWAISAQWAFPAVLTENAVGLPPAEQLPAIHVPYGAIIPTGTEIPVSGIWEPISTPGRCPSYLGAGWPAPEGRRAITRNDRVELDDDGSQSQVTLYEYGTEPTQWQLLWEDHRYEGDQDPDESLYLDASTAPPPWPPAYVAANN